MAGLSRLVVLVYALALAGAVLGCAARHIEEGLPAHAVQVRDGHRRLLQTGRLADTASRSARAAEGAAVRSGRMLAQLELNEDEPEWDDLDSDGSEGLGGGGGKRRAGTGSLRSSGAWGAVDEEREDFVDSPAHDDVGAGAGADFDKEEEGGASGGFDDCKEGEPGCGGFSNSKKAAAGAAKRQGSGGLGADEEYDEEEEGSELGGGRSSGSGFGGDFGDGEGDFEDEEGEDGVDDADDIKAAILAEERRAELRLGQAAGGGGANQRKRKAGVAEKKSSAESDALERLQKLEAHFKAEEERKKAEEDRRKAEDAARAEEEAKQKAEGEAARIAKKKEIAAEANAQAEAGKRAEEEAAAAEAAAAAAAAAEAAAKAEEEAKVEERRRLEAEYSAAAAEAGTWQRSHGPMAAWLWAMLPNGANTGEPPNAFSVTSVALGGGFVAAMLMLALNKIKVGERGGRVWGGLKRISARARSHSGRPGSPGGNGVGVSAQSPTSRPAISPKPHSTKAQPGGWANGDW